MNIFIAKNGRRQGPYTAEQLKALIGRGEVTMSDKAWYEGCAEWARISDMPELVIVICLGCLLVWNQVVKANTASSWATYREIHARDGAYYDLDTVNSLEKRRAAMWEVYSSTMDKDLKILIGARIVLLDKRIELV